jgi:hypothetical protein
VSEHLIPLSAVAVLTGASPRVIENWVGRLELRTHYQETIRGRARLYSRENALELALIAAFAAAGVPPSTAVAYAESHVRDVRSPYGRRLPRWVLFAGRDPRYAKGVKSIDAALASMDVTGRPPVYAAIDVEEILRRVDEAFQ